MTASALQVKRRTERAERKTGRRTTSHRERERENERRKRVQRRPDVSDRKSVV